MTVKRVRRLSAPSPPGAIRRRTDAIQSCHMPSIWAAVNLSSQRNSEWLAEAINDALAVYFTTCQMARAGSASAQAKWAAALRRSADKCLLMLVPEFDRESPPDAYSLNTFHALFNVGTLSEFRDAQRHLFRYEDSDLGTLEKVTEAVWLLGKLADRAQKNWSEEVVLHKNRHKTRQGILVWVSTLGCRYQEAFGKQSPIRPTENSPFSRFVDAVRSVVVGQQTALLDDFNDSKAFRDLVKLGPGALAAFVTRHRDTLRARWSKAQR